MSRNLDRRIELMFPILESAAFKEVKEILETYFADTASAMELKSDGSWKKVEGKKDGVSAQTVLYKKYKKLNEEHNRKLEIEFKVRRK